MCLQTILSLQKCLRRKWTFLWKEKQIESPLKRVLIYLIVQISSFCCERTFQEKWGLVKTIYGKFGPFNCKKSFVHAICEKSMVEVIGFQAYFYMGERK
jgi:hypothetical protein